MREQVDVDALAHEIAELAAKMFANAAASSGEFRRGRVDYEPHGGPRSFVLIYGSEEVGWEDMIEHEAVEELKRKDAKLPGPPETSVVVVDLRSRVLGMPQWSTGEAGDAYWRVQFAARRVREHQEAMSRGIVRYLKEAKAVSGVISWWQRFPWQVTPPERISSPYQFRLASQYGERRTHSEEDLARWLRTLTPSVGRA